MTEKRNGAPSEGATIDTPEASTRERANIMVEGILESRPILRRIVEAPSLLEYLEPALDWNPDRKKIPGRAKLEEIIIEEARRLYGREVSDLLEEQFQTSWTVDTSAHLHLPRRYDRPGKREGYQVNHIVFQGQVLWAAGSRAKKNRVALSLSSGRVPLNNANSGAYLDLPSLESPIRLVSDKFRSTPETFIPAISAADIAKRREQLTTLFRSQQKMSKADFELAMEILKKMEAQRAGFSDQIAIGHGLIMDRILPHDIHSRTIDSERVGGNFLQAMFEDETSVAYRVFVDVSLRTQFLQAFKDIDTGWDDQYTAPLYQVAEKDGTKRFEEYAGDLDPRTLAAKLGSEEISPKGVLKFFTLMVDGGLGVIGGMNQSKYCTEIRDRAAAFLRMMGEEERAQAIETMPTYIAVVSPCWGLSKGEDSVGLLDAPTAIAEPLGEDEIEKIITVKGETSLYTAGPALYSFLRGQAPPIEYRDLLTLIEKEVVVKSSKI